jgi:alkylphenol/PAH-inducible cytochrome P450 monooxygenase
MSENPSLQLSKEEMVSQMAVFTLAGHETTANTLTWLLWELSRGPHFQDKLREEIKQKREDIAAKGDEAADFRMEDLESMPFLQALLKVDLTKLISLVRYIDSSAGNSTLSSHSLSSFPQRRKG